MVAQVYKRVLQEDVMQVEPVLRRGRRKKRRVSLLGGRTVIVRRCFNTLSGSTSLVLYSMSWTIR